MVCMKHLFTHVTAGVAMAMWLPMSAHAIPFVQLNQSVLIHIPAKDVPGFKSFIGETLNSGTSDQVHTWSSTARNNRAPVQVEVTPSAPVTTQAAGQCRLLSAQVHQRSRQESWKVWFCQQANGGWKISALE
jgi:hypothetical protein